MSEERPDPPAHGRDEAVALTYAHNDAAPRVVAKGRGLMAREIIERAHEAGVFVHESPELVGLLMQVDLDDRIPTELYVAVAELLAWLYQVEKRNVRNPDELEARQTKGSATRNQDNDPPQAGRQ